mmetsp:Transcript_52551/g.105257  ORF Transcript_52551/g.105257 Transcript_52551/m.105257 type:complete len:107 (-) Transcript_52551:88-408(-)
MEIICKKEEHLPPIAQCLAAAIQAELRKNGGRRGIAKIQSIVHDEQPLQTVKPFLWITPGAVLQVSGHIDCSAEAQKKLADAAGGGGGEGNNKRGQQAESACCVVM